MLWNRYFYRWLWRSYVVLYELCICIRLPAWYYSDSNEIKQGFKEGICIEENNEGYTPYL